MLERHVIEWLRKHRVGFVGEQGAESIHAAINFLKPSYTNMKNAVQRVKCMLTEHHRQVCPALNQCRPVIKRRKKTEDEE